MEEDHIQFEIDVAADGTWGFDITEQLAPGMHSIIVTDDQGNQDDSLLFVQPAFEQQVIEVQTPGDVIIQEVESIREIIPPWLLWIVIVLVVVFSVFTAVNLYLAHRIRRQEAKAESAPAAASTKGHAVPDEHKNITRLAKLMMFGSLGLLVPLIAIVAYLVASEPTREVLTPERSEPMEVREADVFALAGAVRDPITLKGVPSILLTGGEVAITTTETGQFNFEDIDASEGIRLDHPQLEKTFIFIPEAPGRDDIFFRVDLFQLLSDVVMAEAQGDSDFLHSQLEATPRGLISVETLFEHFEGTYTTEDVSDQTITIQSIERVTTLKSFQNKRAYRNVIRFTTLNGNKTGTYEFFFDDARWWLIK